MPYRVLVAVGDDDSAGDALVRTKQLVEMEKVSKVSVALRTHHPKYDELLELADSSSGKVEILTENEGAHDAARSRSRRADQR